MYSIVKEHFSQRYAGPCFLPGAGVRPYSVFFPSPDMRGMARRRGACPGLLQGGPIRVRASPDRRTLALLRGAPAPLGAPPRHSPQLAFYGGRTRAGPVVPRPGYPAAARVRGCEPRTQVPRPAPPRATPRPKRPSVDGTACTYSESHLECQWPGALLFTAEPGFQSCSEEAKRGRGCAAQGRYDGNCAG